MRLLLCGELVWTRAIILLCLIKLSYQTIYPCNAMASCGCSMNSATVSRIVGGEAASSGTWSWAVSISIDDRYLCGGSIISSSWVLTASHCTAGYTASKLKIYAGSNIQWEGTQTRAVSQLFMHPNYDSSTYENDIALLRLDHPLIMNDQYVKTICLPSVNSATLSAGEWPPANTTVVAVGWGTLSEGGSLPTNLQQVTLETIDHQASVCKSSIADWSIQMCAGVPGGGKDTCQGDSGGPLMMFSSEKQWVLVGVTSFGYGCAQPNYAGVYTRVAAFENWINSTMHEPIPTPTTTVNVLTSTTTDHYLSLHANTIGISVFNVILFVFMDLAIAFSLYADV